MLEIRHEPPACVAAGKYARLDACFRPASALARARLYFRKLGTADWFYVDMAPYAPCHRGVLPRPRKDIGSIEYYISGTDKSSAESRTQEGTLLVTADGQCAAGPLAPIAESGGVVIGSASGAAPVGFLTGGLSPLLVAGGALVVGGGAAAVLAGGGDTPSTTTTTTTLPVVVTTTTTSPTTTTTTTTTLPPPTTTTTTQPSPPTTTTTTTTLACESPNQKPVANIIDPVTGPLAQPAVEVRATASDPSPGSGVREVRFGYQYCPAAGCGGEAGIGTDTSGPSPYTIFWTLPSCGVAPEDRFRILARAVDSCGNVSDVATVDVRSVGRGCFRAPGVKADAGSWQSELEPAGARGQVVIDGAQAFFPSSGVESFPASLGLGVHRFEATLVTGAARDGGSGRWRFDLQALHVAPGSLRVVAGDVLQLGADAVVFRLRGRSGERVVFSFQLAGE